MSTPKRDTLEVFDNPCPERDYEITHVAHEFTSVCPITGHPDFATMTLRYVPGDLCVELKSLKLYLQAYRNEGVFYEALTNKILDDLAAVCSPKRMMLTAAFTRRGGLSSVVVAQVPADAGPWPAAQPGHPS